MISLRDVRSPFLLHLARCALVLALGFTGAVVAQTPRLSIGSSQAEVGSTGSVTLSIDGLASAQVFAFRMEVAFDPTIATALDPSRAGTLTDGWVVASNRTTPGILVISAAGATALSGDGLLLELQFDGIAVGNTTLDITQARLNEGNPSVSTENGQLDIVEATVVEQANPDQPQLDIADLYPNPTTGAIHTVLSVDPASHVRIWVVDMLGRIQFSVSDVELSSQPALRIETSSLVPGSYAVCAADGDSAPSCRRFSKVAEQ
ncbi:MAG: cohesin domain-containing protein [Bacteroidota bacterium]